MSDCFRELVESVSEPNTRVLIVYDNYASVVSLFNKFSDNSLIKTCSLQKMVKFQNGSEIYMRSVSSENDSYQLIANVYSKIFLEGSFTESVRYRILQREMPRRVKIHD